MTHDSISGIDFSDNEYLLKQKAVRNAYKLYDSEGNEVLKTKQKLMKMKEEFPFKTPQGKEVFTVKAQNVMDIAGDYALEDAQTGEQFAVLKKNFSILIHTWDIEDGDGNHIAHVESRGKAVGLMRSLTDLAEFFPHKYTIEDSEGNQIGTIQEHWSLRDRYDIELEEGLENREAILASVATIDALEGN
jgi:uncharacterized protein YxjI